MMRNMFRRRAQLYAPVDTRGLAANSAASDLTAPGEDDSHSSVTHPRIEPLHECEWDERQRILIEAAAAGRVAAINTTLARCPEILELVSALGRELRSERIPARDREVAILRTGWRCRSEYVTAEHRRIGLAAGLTADDVDCAITDPGGFSGDSFDAVICRLVDELHQSSCVSDTTWRAVVANYDEQQSIQIVSLVGFYHMLSYFLNALRVPLDQVRET